MHWLEIVLTIIGAVAASSGFWAWVQSKQSKNNAHSDMLLGLGHDRIVFLCMKYIDRGWVTGDEFENLNTYLYEPYVKMGGNGTAKRLMALVEKLPVRKVDYHSALTKAEENGGKSK